MELLKFPYEAQFSASSIHKDFLKNTQNNYEHQTLDIPNDSNPILTSNPFLLSFKNLTYNVKVGHKSRLRPCCGNNIVPEEDSMKILLDDISGEAREGEIMAILGASGSGKSTLLDALANRIDKNSLKGSVTLNGEVLELGLLKVISAYVMQDDLLFPMLTVEETLMFSADFRLPRSLSKAKKKARVQALIDQLGLRNAAKTIIGDEGHRGVSGGERRRVSIGIDVIHDPILLFLDEPTSGLDSTSAYKVVKVLQQIAQSGSIVIMSIHQPSFRITGLLDRLIFLSRGQTVYSGSPTNLPCFFDDFGHPFPENGNPAEFALDFIRELEESPSGTWNLVQFNKSCQASMNPDDVLNYKKSLALKDAIKRSIAQGKLVSGAIATTDLNLTTSSSVPLFANPFWYEMLVLAKRLVTNLRRTPEEFGARVGIIIVTAGIISALYRQIDNSPKGVQERMGSIAISLAAVAYISTIEVPEFIKERYIFMRETSYNAYRRSSYAFARSFISIPALIILSLIFSIIIFWPLGFSGGLSGFFFFFLTNLAMFWTANSLVAFLSGVIPNLIIAITISIAAETYFLFFCGFLVPQGRLPRYMIWLHYMSILKYPYEALLQNEFLGSKCFVRGTEIFELTPLGELPITLKDKLLMSIGNVVGRNVTGSTCITVGDNILKLQEISQLSKWNCLWITIAWGFFYRFLFYLTLLFGSKNKRK